MFEIDILDFHIKSLHGDLIVQRRTWTNVRAEVKLQKDLSNTDFFPDPVDGFMYFNIFMRLVK